MRGRLRRRELQYIHAGIPALNAHIGQFLQNCRERRTQDDWSPSCSACRLRTRASRCMLLDNLNTHCAQTVWQAFNHGTTSGFDFHLTRCTRLTGPGRTRYSAAFRSHTGRWEPLPVRSTRRDDRLVVTLLQPYLEQDNMNLFEGSCTTCCQTSMPCWPSTNPIRKRFLPLTRRTRSVLNDFKDGPVPNR